MVDEYYIAMAHFLDEVPIVRKIPKLRNRKCECDHCTNRCRHTAAEKEASARLILLEKLSQGLPHEQRILPACPACWIEVRVE